MKSILYPLLISIGIVLLTFGIFHSIEENYSNTLHLLEENPIQFGIVSFLILVSDIILPVPSSIVLYINGYFLGILSGTLVSFLGLMVGSIIGYYLGRAGSFLFESENSQKAFKILERYGPSAIFLTRGIPILSESICFVCGYKKIDFQRYFFLNLIGYFPLCLIHAIFGNLGYEGGAIFLFSLASSIGISLAFWIFRKKLLPENGLV